MSIDIPCLPYGRNPNFLAATIFLTQTSISDCNLMVVLFLIGLCLSCLNVVATRMIGRDLPLVLQLTFSPNRKTSM